MIDCFPTLQEAVVYVSVDFLSMPGWSCNTKKSRQCFDLPLNAQSTSRELEELLCVPVKWVVVRSECEAVIAISYFID